MFHYAFYTALFMVPGIINMYRAILDAINNKSVLERDGIWILCHIIIMS